MKNVIAVINKRTKIELGMIIAILSLSGGVVPFAYHAFATVEQHGVAITELKQKVDKVDKIAEDVAYIRGRIDKREK